MAAKQCGKLKIDCFGNIRKKTQQEKRKRVKTQTSLNFFCRLKSCPKSAKLLPGENDEKIQPIPGFT